ncbi:hypothetical protein D8674_018000 [Pyrus ussuriensis x Pyrus communis]|uniref:Uncharacterized protein n=1 Tax=Pyrus ussuriensis x Pyrus communis TaxID=2448454 RepID=A0A5N5HLD1_9ROSA|nr:hypothetical protein D8674_018000 [Pyrus ussuriensis x Pyrus communis]
MVDCRSFSLTGFLCSMVWSILLSFSPQISASTGLLLDQKLVAIQNPLTRMRIKSNLKPDNKELQVGNDNDNGVVLVFHSLSSLLQKREC